MRNRKVLCALAACAGLLLFLGCVGGLQGLAFSHKTHANEASCTDCHADGARARHQACQGCHEIDEAKPSDACRTCHPGGQYRVGAPKPASYADVVFDHAPHADQPCERCHAGAARSSKAGDSNLPKMDTCTACHDGDTAPSACSTCHEKIRKEVRPESHSAAWPRAHGDVAQLDKLSCTYCHDRTGCEDCHTTRRPAGHTPGWKNSGHGIAADFDRRACDTCHRADECSRCHQMRPPSHFGARFRIPLAAGEGHARLVSQRGGARSCVACHERSFCLSCHPGGL